jgi:gamma-glutamyltranspeptidase/glutathione hydrolase
VSCRLICAGLGFATIATLRRLGLDGGAGRLPHTGGRFPTTLREMTEYQDPLSARQMVRKPAVTTGAGVAVTHNRIASLVAARVLAEGGHAVDAAIAASFALGVVEPWMSGVGGVGAMLVHDAASGTVQGFDFGAVSPQGVRREDYDILGGADSDLFGWPQVRDNRNVVGAPAVVAPSLVGGLDLAHRTYGALPWARLVEPAIALAREGVPVAWPTTLIVATAFSDLSRDAASRAVFLPGGAPPVPPIASAAPVLLRNRALADTLAVIAGEGAAALYRGSLAAALVSDLAAMGGVLSQDDMARARAVAVTPAKQTHASHVLHVLPELNGGPTAARALATLDDHGHAGRYDPAAPGPVTAMAAALREAWTHRFASMGDSGGVTSTTHVNIIDRKGNAVALTQTLLSLFGARVMSPSTGILMNNGMNWFDPRGGPNGLAPGRRALANYCPVLLTAERDVIAIGGAGGRKILPAVAQLAAMVTSGMTIEGAMHHPRIDVSGTDTVVADARLPEGVRAALSRKFTTLTATPTVYPYPFTIASIARRHHGETQGASDPVQPTTEAVAEDEA